MSWIHRASGHEVSAFGGFPVIYADPAWSYRNKGRGAAENHYRTMAHSELCALPVLQLAAPDCALFMWGTYPNTPEALEVIAAWGFTFKTLAFQWVKLNKRNGQPFTGLGHYTRANSEPCWFATRGAPQRVHAGVHQLIETLHSEEEMIRTPIGEHSEKPPEARDRILKLMGDVPAIELFARQRVSGWECWGNEVEQTVELRTA